MRRELVLALAVLAACGPKILWTGHTEDRRARIEILEDGGRTFVVVDGVRRGGYRGVAVPSLVLAGSHVAFAARVGAQWTVAVDGVNGPSFASIGEIVLSPTGRVAYVAERARKWHVVVDGVVGPPFEAILAHTLQLAGDGIVYVARDAAGVHVARDAAGAHVVGTTVGPAFDGISQLVVAGAHVAYAGRRGSDIHVVHDGVIGRAWPAVGKLRIVANRVAFAASDGEGWRVIAGDDVYPKVDKVHAIYIRDDGAYVAWLATIAHARMLALGAIPLATSPALREDLIAFRPAASATEVGLAYVEPTDGGQHLVLDGVAGPTFDEVRAPVWNRAGRLAYAARRKAAWFIVYNGLEHGHGEWVSEPVLDDNGTLGYVRRDHGRTDVIVGGTAHHFDLVFEDTLVLAHGRWAVAAGDIGKKAVFISIDGTRRVPVPSTELYASAVNSDPKDNLRRWTERELAR